MGLKKIVVWALLLTLLLATPAFAVEIDLDGMSVEELIELKDEINQKIAELGGSNVISSGVYVVGKDIKAERFTLYASPSIEYTRIWLWPSMESYSNGDISDIIIYTGVKYDLEENKSADAYSISLEDGQCLVINGAAIIEEAIKPSWAP